MPKVVDAEERRAAVAAAVLRVAERDGLRRASLRTVADEAGLNIGSVRHYFRDQAELMRFAMRSIIDRTSARVAARASVLAAAPPAERARRRVELLAELLPLDGERRAEVAVLLEFLLAARSDPGLEDLAREAARGTLALAERVAEALLEPDGSAVAVESQRLAALLDGLALHHVLAPDLTTVDDCVAALDAHLAQLASGQSRRSTAVTLPSTVASSPGIGS